MRWIDDITRFAGQQIGTRRHKIEFDGQKMLRNISCSGRKLLENSNSSRASVPHSGYCKGTKKLRTAMDIYCGRQFVQKFFRKDGKLFTIH